jgi:competence protein ComEA
MDRSASPWHVLDGSQPPASPPDADPARPVRWPLVGGIVMAAGLALVALGLVVSGPQPQTVIGVGVGELAAAPADPSAAPAAPTVATQLVVHVAGAVRRPGLVRLAPGSRVADAIEAAGGLGPRVDAVRVDRELNLAAPVADGDRILVPSRDEASGSPDPGAASATASPGRVDLNHASAEALDALPGIGPVTAAKIIAAREEQPFRSLDELVSRKVLGQATLTKIRALVELR